MPLFQPDWAAIEEQQGIIRELKSKARFFCLFMYAYNKRAFLADAYDAGMINGEYVFFGNELATITDEVPGYRPDLNDELLFEGFLYLAPSTPSGPRFDQFATDVVASFDDPLFDGFDHTNSTEDVSMYAGEFDCC